MTKTIKEAIVVEGRDDTAAIKRAVDAHTIETHGYGIKKETWQLIEKAYNAQGIIIFTDPDFAGNEIRKRIKEKFPDAREAFLPRKEAENDGDIGIENAAAEAIRAALSKARCTISEKSGEYTAAALAKDGLAGGPGARERREALGKILGIGYGNTAAMANKLNSYGIKREEYNEALRTIYNQGD